MKAPEITLLDKKIIPGKRYELQQHQFEYLQNGQREIQQRDVFERGNGACVLLYNPEKQTVVLISQFRLPTYLNGNPGGMLIEVCAGTLDESDPAQTVIREAEEETGYHIERVTKVFEMYPSPGAVTEIIYCFVAEYEAAMQKSAGGGLAEEHEHIEILEMPFTQALAMVSKGEIRDAKTIMLLQYAQIHKLMEV